MRDWRFGWQWEALGRRDAMGAIITREGAAGAWDPDQFLATGRADAARFVADLGRVRPALRRGSILDFGCGIGRVTRALADFFEAAVGVDVARSMIRRARELNRDRPRCRFVLNRALHLRQFTAGAFDVVYSRLVLQHVPPPVVRRYLPELVRVLAPGGVLMFQLPTEMSVDPRREFLNAPVVGSRWKRRLPRPIVRAHRRVKYAFIAPPRPEMEMFGLATPDVIGILRAAGAVILEIRDDASHGEGGVPGYEYWVTRE